MTTKNNRPSRLAQTLESPGADQWYPVWEEEKMWDKVSELSASTTNSSRRKYGFWIILLGLCWSASGTDRVADAQKSRAVEPLKTAPVARIELPSKQKIVPVDIQMLRRMSDKKIALPHSLPSATADSFLLDSVVDEALAIETTLSPLPQIGHLAWVQQVYPTTLSPVQLPPKPWRKKHSTLYTLRVPETPYDWDLKEGFVRRLEQQVKSVPVPHNGWMAFQLHWESGTAFTLTHHSRDTLNLQDTEIHLRTKNR